MPSSLSPPPPPLSSRHRPLSLLPLFLLLSLSAAGNLTSPSQCASLLDLKRSFSLDPSSGLASWRPNTDCCAWVGVRCEAGLVTAVDLSSRSISGNISVSLFNLTSLRSLNLAYNKFDQIPIPNELQRLSNLTSLNLSNAGFTGQIPIGIAKLTHLVSLDLSSLSLNEVGYLELKDPSFETLIDNLSGLRELYLDGVNVSANGYRWCGALAKSAPNLRALSLSSCSITGPIDSSLAELRELSIIRLDQNELKCSLPAFFGNFSSLSVVRLSFCELNGSFPENVFLLKNLTSVDLESNLMLSGSLPDFSEESKLERLVLSNTKFSRSLPNSIGKVKSLRTLDVSSCRFSGEIPSSIQNLTLLDYLDLSLNNFSGAIPNALPPRITEFIVKSNMLTGSIPSSIGNLKLLLKLDLSNNSISGQIPASLFSLPSLKILQLSVNQLSGELQVSNGSSNLSVVDLSYNKLQGNIPRSVFKLPGLKILTLASNDFNGIVKLDWVGSLKNLSNLDLSYNRILIQDTNGIGSFSFPNISSLMLVSCNLTRVPSFLRHQNHVNSLDLSNNWIAGAIPEWIWSIGNYNLNYLNLSHNMFTSIEGPLPNFNVNWSINNLDLHSNLIRGSIPLPPSNTIVLDYSNNCFSSSIPSNISSYLSYTVFFSLANNDITGEIPPSICNATYLKILDLSNNSLSGSIPRCLFKESNNLVVVSLWGNQLDGTIPPEISEGCGLRTINLNGNRLDGPVPQSLINCSELEILDLGNNLITGPFPFWIGDIYSLQVLVLRSNQLYGPISATLRSNSTNGAFSKLQIFDVSSNSLNGTLPLDCFKNLKAMMLRVPNFSTVQIEYLNLKPIYYQNTITVTSKGQVMTLVRVLTIYTSLDFSNNRFKGNIPELGELASLLFLNFSHNALTGKIPTSIGNLVELEALDLSANQLSGEIPPVLSSLTFLSVLNLSNNNLTGKIPQNNQFSTFSNSSFEGNKGLCGSPLTRQCGSPLEPEILKPDITTDVNWQFVFIGLGFGGGLAILFGTLMIWEKGRMWYNKKVDEMFMAIVPLIYSKLCDYFRDRRVGAEEMEGDSEDIDKLNCRRFCVLCTKLEFCQGRLRVIHVECDCPLEGK